jgi:hypothetical protein
VWRCAVRCSTDAAKILESDARSRCSTLQSVLETVMGDEKRREELLHKISQSPFCRPRGGARQVVEQLLAALRGDADALGDCPSLAVALLQVSWLLLVQKLAVAVGVASPWHLSMCHCSSASCCFQHRRA